MKRHESLVQLSRDHHQALILAQLIKKNAPAYKGMPTTLPGKIIYAVNLFNTELKKHFEKEEAMLQLVNEMYPAINKISGEIFEEHIALSALFLSLEGSADQENLLDELGNKLDAHIRKEERILFPLIQDYCTEEQLLQLKTILN